MILGKAFEYALGATLGAAAGLAVTAIICFFVWIFFGAGVHDRNGE